MLKLSHLTIRHTKDLRDLVRDLSLTIHEGEKVAIIGEEGNGKSSLLHVLMSPKSLPDYLTIEGEITTSFHSYAYIPQTLPEALKGKTLEEYFFGEDELDYTTLYRLADQFHFNSERFASDQAIGSLSGGEALKVQLLHELCCPHELLFLDEPSNDLDIETLDWIQQMIQTSPQTILFISHHEDFLTQTADTIIHLRQIKHRKEAETIVEHLGYQDYSSQREQQFKQQSQQAVNDQRAYRKTMEKHRRVRQQVETSLRNTKDSTAGRLLAKKMKSLLSQEKRYEREFQAMTSQPYDEEIINLHFPPLTPLSPQKRVLLLDQEELAIGDRVLVKNLSLTLQGQDKIGIIGSNGVGKSTFLKMIWEILQNNESIRTAYMPQDYTERLPLTQTPVQFLQHSGDREEINTIQLHLASLNFTYSEMHHPISELSGGQQGKLFLLQLVLTSPQFLLLDEPTRNFSPTSQPEIRRLFADYPGGLVTVSHDRTFLKEVCQKIYRLTESGFVEIESL